MGLWPDMGRKEKVSCPVSKIHTKRGIPKAVLGTPGKKLLSQDGLGCLVTGVLLLPHVWWVCKAVSRVAIETAATLVSTENTWIYRNCARGSINFDITAFHFKWLTLHPTATLFWRFLGLEILFLNRKIFGSLWVFPPHTPTPPPSSFL